MGISRCRNTITSARTITSRVSFDRKTPEKSKPAASNCDCPQPDKNLMPEAFWTWAWGVTATRADTEGWTSSDLFAALLQVTFLSYTSHPECPRYSSTCPDHAVHNAPWNDWTPPSKSLERFHKAQLDMAPDPVQQRVRVRLCSSADALGLEHSVIAFAPECHMRMPTLCS